MKVTIWAVMPILCNIMAESYISVGLTAWWNLEENIWSLYEVRTVSIANIIIPFQWMWRIPSHSAVASTQKKGIQTIELSGSHHWHPDVSTPQIHLGILKYTSGRRRVYNAEFSVDERRYQKDIRHFKQFRREHTGKGLCR